MAKFGFTVLLLGSIVAMPAMAQTTAPTGGTTMQGAPSGNLSSQLSKSGGVITPNSDVDPGMHVPAPDPHPNSTPVIPPSATGGNSAK